MLRGYELKFMIKYKDVIMELGAVLHNGWCHNGEVRPADSAHEYEFTSCTIHNKYATGKEGNRKQPH